MRNNIILYNIFILLILLFIIELVFRVFGFGVQNAPLENDSYLHHRNPANYSFTCYSLNGEYGGHDIYLDSIGRRIDEAQKKKVKNKKVKNKKVKNKKVWFLGDSFTAAFQVKWEDSFVGILDSLSEYNVENYGVSSYSPLLYYLQLKLHLSSKVKPEKIFIQLYSNDIAGDKMYAQHTSFMNDEPVACVGEDPQHLLRLLRKSYIVRVLRKTQLTIQYLFSRDEELRVKDHVEPVAVIDTESYFCRNILLIKELLESYGIEYYFFSIPSKYACVSGDWDSANFSINTNEFFRNKNISYIDINNYFKNHIKPSSLFYNKDIHCNEIGNLVIANALINKF